MDTSLPHPPKLEPPEGSQSPPETEEIVFWSANVSCLGFFKCYFSLPQKSKTSQIQCNVLISISVNEAEVMVSSSPSLDPIKIHSSFISVKSPCTKNSIWTYQEVAVSGTVTLALPVQYSWFREIARERNLFWKHFHPHSAQIHLSGKLPFGQLKNEALVSSGPQIKYLWREPCHRGGGTGASAWLRRSHGSVPWV